jgi:hypothetical protein
MVLPNHYIKKREGERREMKHPVQTALAPQSTGKSTYRVDTIIVA